MKSPEIDPSIHGNLVYDNVGISDHWDETDLFFKMVPEQPHSHFRKRLKENLFHTIYRNKLQIGQRSKNEN